MKFRLPRKLKKAHKKTSDGIPFKRMPNMILRFRSRQRKLGNLINV